MAKTYAQKNTLYANQPKAVRDLRDSANARQREKDRAKFKARVILAHVP
jgi:hypothetical protein